MASPQSGSDHPASGVWRNTYFNSSYDTFGVSQIITVPPNDRDPTYANGLGKIEALLRELAPECDLPILLVNDFEYGGSGGSVLIVSVNSAAVELLLHETGHTLGGLVDEYEGSYPGQPREAPNSTSHTKREEIPWAVWISPDTPLPTPPTAEFASVIGLFEGAQYQSKGWYRPKLDCKMRTLGKPFCEICREQLVKRLYAFCPPATNPIPQSNYLVVTNDLTLQFRVTLAQPRSQGIQTTWLLDGAEIPGAHVDALDLDPATLQSGLHSLVLIARDSSGWVMSDPEGLVTARFEWTLHVERPVLRFVSVGVQDCDRILLSIQGHALHEFVLEASHDLLNWYALATNAMATTTTVIETEKKLNESATFYRAVAR